jgi:hypothetical protein
MQTTARESWPSCTRCAVRLLASASVLCHRPCRPVPRGRRRA